MAALTRLLAGLVLAAALLLLAGLLPAAALLLARTRVALLRLLVRFLLVRIVHYSLLASLDAYAPASSAPKVNAGNFGRLHRKKGCIGGLNATSRRCRRECLRNGLQ